MKTVTFLGILATMLYSSVWAQETTLLRFNALGGDGIVELSWETRHETDLIGFDLFRSEGDSAGPFIQMATHTQDSVLVARGTENLFSRRYSWNDRKVMNDKTYWYQLRLVSKDGHASFASTVSTTPSAGLIINQVSEKIGWEWQNPAPPSNHYWDVDFVDAEHGWVVGEFGTILRTTDGGRSWKLLDSGVEINSGGTLTEITFRQVKFFDRLNGVVGGYTVLGTNDGAGEQLILRTTDGGETWQVTLRFRNLSGTRYLDMFFLDATHGWFFIDGYGTLRTLDGGFSWKKISNVPPPFSTGGGVQVIPTGLSKLFFTSPAKGWGGLTAETVYSTTDSGKTWHQRYVSNLATTQDIFFLDDQTGWMIDDMGKIYRTSNGGINWNLQHRLNTFLFRIRFVDQSTGFALGFGNIFKTVNGGISWTSLPLERTTFFTALEFVNEVDLWLVGGNGVDPSAFAGMVFHSQDRGETWNAVNRGFATSIVDLKFVDLNLGWALGAQNDTLGQSYAVLLNTIDGGKHWQLQTNFPTGRPLALHVFDAQQSVIATTLNTGDPSTSLMSVYRTSNGGISWERSDLSGHEFQDIYFLDPLHGWAGGTQGLLLWTDDGARSWHPAELLMDDRSLLDVQRIRFMNSREGWVSAWNGREYPFYGVFLTTKDGGRTWQQIWREEERIIADFTFIDSLQGWATGNQNTILLTFDGGRHWEKLEPGLPEHWFIRIVFVDRVHGWALSNYGRVIYTTDGGRNWKKQKHITDGLTTLTFVDPVHGWLAGGQGKILATVQGGLPLRQLTGVAERDRTKLIASFRLSQNYPNPFNPATTITYDLGENSRVTLRIFNTLGQEVRTLVDRRFERAGLHIVSWDGRDNHGNTVVSGIFFYRLETDKVIITKKMVLIR